MKTMASVLLLPLLVLILSEGTVALGDNGPPGGESVQQLLENALLNNSYNLNRLQIQFPTGDLPPLTCVPVKYILLDFDYTYNDTEAAVANAIRWYSYLWTIFNTEKKIPGHFILLWLMSETYTIGFDLEGACKYYLNDALTLILLVENETLSNETEIAEALKNITLKLRAYAETGGDNNQTSGYAREWNAFTVSKYHGYTAGAEIAIAIMSNMITVAFAPLLFSKLKQITQNQIKKDTTTKYFLGSLYCLIFLWTWVGIPIVIVMSHSESFIVTWLQCSLYGFCICLGIISYIFYFWGTNIKDIHTCNCYSKCTCTTMIHAVAFVTSVNFLSFTLYFFLSIAVAFYAYPSRILIRLSFLQFAIVCLVMGVALLIFVLTGSFKQLKELIAPQDSHSNGNQEPQNTENYESEQELQNTENHESEKAPLVPRNGNQEPETKCTFQDFFISLFVAVQAVTVLMLLVFLIFVLIVAGGVVFEATKKEVHTFNDYLTVLPTIAVNSIILLKKFKYM